MEGSGASSAEYRVHLAETVNSAGSAWYVGNFKLCCEILCDHSNYIGILYSNRMLYYILTFRLLFCSLHQSIHSSVLVHAVYALMKTAEYIAVETSAFF